MTISAFLQGPGDRLIFSYLTFHSLGSITILHNQFLNKGSRDANKYQGGVVEN